MYTLPPTYPGDNNEFNARIPDNITLFDVRESFARAIHVFIPFLSLVSKV